jgi:colicin import membrane protein
MSYALTMREEFAREHGLVLLLSVFGHAVLLGLLVMNLEFLPRPSPQPVRLAIQATVVDSSAMQRMVAEQQRQQALAVERQRQAEERQREVERQREQQLREAEQRREAQAEQARREEQKRQQEAEQARLAKLERERQDAEQKKREAAEAERKADEARRKAESERRSAQARADLARQMAEEENLVAAAESGLLDQYAEIIRQKVERNWIRPASARPGLNCVVLVKQIPGGDVVDVRVAECNGDAAVVRSIEAAVIRSSPLPPPPDPSLFDRSLRFEFKPEE